MSFRIFSYLVTFLSLQGEDFPNHWVGWMEQNGLASCFENIYQLKLQDNFDSKRNKFRKKIAILSTVVLY